ncbi:MAG: hypothetical protein HYT19_00620 [Candidatus Nealsonbacteria bacterium]|nr:hypothetical protein [Candidatus Nealsonbacteria bacterium]
MKSIISAFKIVFKETLYIWLALSLGFNLLGVYYFIFSQSTTFKVYFESNTAFYNWSSIVLTVIISLLFGLVLTFLIWLGKNKISQNPTNLGNGLISGFLGAISTGCPVCGAFLISLLGVGGGLAAFPFQGLEIKVISLGLLSFAVFSSAKDISNKDCVICQPSKIAIKPFLPAFIGFLLLFFIAYLPVISHKYNFSFTFQKKIQTASLASPQISASDILESINPVSGFTVNISYGNLGPQLLAAGVIDFNKIKALYEEAGQPLTTEQIKILTEGSNEKIKITPENSYFLLNFFWALGLANKNVILDQGAMTKYGKDQIGNFASTGGWTLGKKEAMDLYSKFEIIKLNPGQQSILEDFADNSYRPCCSNPVSFPDCNHGMAALALGELMASQGATVDQIFEAYKYFNSFWFPQTYLDVATYFKAAENKNWDQVDNRVVASKDFSTPQGWQRVRQWLTAQGLLEKAPDSGGGCGV